MKISYMAIPGIERNPAVSLENAFDLYCTRAELHYGITKGEILGTSRQRPLSIIRHVIQYIIASEMSGGASLVGRITNKHHASVLHACNNVRFALSHGDVMYKPIYQALKNNTMPQRKVFTGRSSTLTRGGEYIVVNLPDVNGLVTVIDDRGKPKKISQKCLA